MEGEITVMLSFGNDMLEAAAFQLALDMGCDPQDFLKSSDTIVSSRLSPGRRNIRPEKDFLRLATMGNGVVASISPEIFTFTKALLGEMNESIEVFDAKGVYFINKELEKYGKALGAFHQYYLPSAPYNYSEADGYKLEVFEGSDISKLYEYGKFPNALLYNTDQIRRDVLAVCLFNGSSIAGIAGASNDSERFWQIGIDIMPEYRNKGLATEIVSKITKEILMRGAIPYYGTWWSNIASRKVAKKCGYFPAWAETYAVDNNR